MSWNSLVAAASKAAPLPQVNFGPLVTDNSASQSTFQDPYNFHSNLNGYGSGTDIGSWFAKTFGGYDKQAEYQRRVEAENREYERQSIASARAWDEFVNTHKYQWAVADLKAAGLNPWLAAQGGLAGNQISSTASSANQTTEAKSSRESSKNVLGQILGAVAKVVSAALMVGLI